jgi:putative transposase
MSNKYLGKYRNESARAQWWDYSRNGAYFITICTKNREHFFGEIRHGTMHLNDIGKLADKFWLEIPDHFPGVFLDVHQIMPNHMHGILVIDKMDGENCGVGIVRTPVVGTPNLGVPTTGNRTELASQRWKPQSVGVIINQYKRKCTIDAWKTNSCFAWQPRFHDHIIRNDQEFQRIREYIINNPKNWESDSLK